MKAEDLKTGMIVVFETEERGLVLDNEIFLVDTNHKFCGSIHRRRGCERGIVKVYTPKTPANTNIGANLTSFMYMEDSFFNLVWEHKEPIEEMTLEQIYKELGREVKVVK